jgi:hypothetical protein
MVAFATLWENHPANLAEPAIEPCRTASGVRAYDNQCAIRLGLCLSRSGISLMSFRGAFCWYGHGRQHPLRVADMGTWLNSASATFVGTATKQRRANAHPISHYDYAHRRGIAMWLNFWGAGNQGDHIDLWDGEYVAHGDPDYFERSQEVWFWDIL